MKRLLLCMLIMFGFATIQGQDIEKKKATVQKVFDRIINAYNSPKNSPELILVAKGEHADIIAYYTTDPRPIIYIDEKLVDICMKCGADSLNALAIIIAHELSHHYNNDSYCIDYAYAVGKKSSVSRTLVRYAESDQNKITKEYRADENSIYYASAAGYYPFRIFSDLLDKVYTAYHLLEKIDGYPLKKERKQVKNDAEEYVSKLVMVFKAANILSEAREYEAAAACFDYISGRFPGREIYNNAGVSRLLKAMDLKVPIRIDFIYPVELDPVSRLESNGTRGMTNNEEQVKLLLKTAKDNFNAAIKSDPDYINAMINLACLQDIAGNHDGARGTLIEIPSADTAKYVDIINIIRGISYYNDGNKIVAGDYFRKLPTGKDSIFDYNARLYAFGMDSTDIGPELNAYQNQWHESNKLNKNVPTEDQKKYYYHARRQYDQFQNVKDKKNIMVHYDNDQTSMEILIDGKKVLAAVETADKKEWIIKMDEYWKSKNKKPWMTYRFK